MELRVMNTFLRASQTESFSKAAEDLGYSQAAVTLQIRQLEEELGVTLFERIGKRVRLTDKGAEFAEKTARLLNQLEDAVYSLNADREISGRLSIAASESVCDVFLPDIISEFIKRYPKVEITLLSGPDYTFYDMLQRNEVDLAIINDGLDDRRFQVVTVMEESVPVVFVAATRNPLVSRTDVDIDELLSQPIVSTERDLNSRYDLDRVLKEKGYDIEIKPVVNAASTSFLVELILRSSCIAFLPAYVVNKNISSGEMSIIRCSQLAYETTTRMVHHKNKVITPQMKAGE